MAQEVDYNKLPDITPSGGSKQEVDYTSLPDITPQQPSTAPDPTKVTDWDLYNTTMPNKEETTDYGKLSFLDNGISLGHVNVASTDVSVPYINEGQKNIAQAKLDIYNNLTKQYEDNVDKASAQLGLPKDVIKGLNLVQESTPFKPSKTSTAKTTEAALYRGIGETYKFLDGVGNIVGDAIGVKPRSDSYFSYLGKLGNDAIKSADEIDKEYTPDQSVVGQVLSGMASLAPDLVMSYMMPETKVKSAWMFGKKGLSFVLPKFATWLGIKEIGKEKTINPNGDIIDYAKAGAKGFSEGMILHGIGATGGEIEKVVAAYGGDALAQTAASAIGEGLMFWGDALTKDPRVYTDKDGGLTFNWDEAKKHLAPSLGMALAFKAGDIPSAIKRSDVLNSITQKSYMDYYTSPIEDVKFATSVDKSPRQLRAVSEKLWIKAKEAKTDVERSQYLAAKHSVDKVSRIKMMADVIAKNPEQFKSDIEKDSRLNREQKDAFKDKIDQTTLLNEQNTIPEYKIEDKTFDNKEQFMQEVNKMKPDDASKVVIKNDLQTADEVSSIFKDKIKQDGKPTEGKPAEGKPTEVKPTEAKIVEPAKPEDIPTEEAINAEIDKIKAESPEVVDKTLQSDVKPETKMPELEGKFVTYDGEKGKLVKDKNGYSVVLPSGEKRFVESGESGRSAEDLGVYNTGKTPSYNASDSSIDYLGKKFKYDSVNTDKEGNTVSINATNEQGKQVTIRNKDVVNEIEQQKVMSEMDESGTLKDVAPEQVTKAAEEVKAQPYEQTRTEQPVEAVPKRTTGESAKTVTEKPTGKQQRAKRIAEIDAELGSTMDDLLSALGGLTSLTGEQRQKIVPVAVKLAKLYAEKYALKGQDLIDAVVEHFKSKNIPLDDQTIKEIENAQKINEVRSQSQGATEGKTKEQAVQRMGGVREVNRTEAPQKEETKVSRLSERIKSKDTKVNQKVKDLYDGTYKPVKDKDVIESANLLVDNLDYPDILTVVQNNNVEGTLRETTGVFYIKKTWELSEKALERGDTELADEFSAQQNAIAKSIEKMQQDAGRIVRAAGVDYVTSILAPRTQSNRYREGVKKAREQAKNPGSVFKKKQERFSKKAKEVSDQSANDTRKSPSVKKAKDKVVSDTAKQKGKMSAAEKLAERIVSSMKPTKETVSPESRMLNTLLAKFKERDIKIEDKKETSDVQKLAEAISLRDQYSSVWKEAKDETIKKIKADDKLTEEEQASYIDRVNNAYDTATKTPISDAMINRAVKEQMKKIDMSIDDVIRKHYDIQGRNKKQLVDALVNESGLSGKDAETLADVVSKEFDRIIGERAKKLVDKYIQKVKNQNTESGKETQRTRKDESQRLIELISAGAFKNEEFIDAYMTINGVPEINKAHIAEIEKMARKIHDLKRESIRVEATRKLMSYMANIEGLSWTDIADAVWYANVLSGFSTQTRNFYGAGVDEVYNVFTSAGVDPIRWKFMLEGMFQRGIPMGYNTALDAFKTGHTPFETRIEAGSVSERLADREGLKNVNLAKAIRAVGRTMNAGDGFWVTTGKESYASMMTYDQMDVNRFKYSFSKEYRDNINKMVKEKLGVSKEQLAEIKSELDKEAVKEGYSPEQKNRVMLEMIDELRDPAIVQAATEEATRSTGNVNTYGTVGMVADKLAYPFREIEVPIWKKKDGTWHRAALGGKIVAFSRISANLAERALDYTPVGFGRAFAGKSEGQNGRYGFLLNINKPSHVRYIRELSPEQRVQMLKRAAIGTATHLGILAFAASSYDKDDPFIRITANGTGDWTANKQLEATGKWKPYTIYIGGKGISYRYTPMILSLAPIGYASDMMRYNNDKGDKDFWTQYGMGMGRTPATVLDMTALAQVNKAFQMVANGTNVKTLQNFVANIVKGYYTPGLLRDVEKIYDVMAGVPQKENDNFMDKLIHSNPIWVSGERIAGKSVRQNAINILGEPIDVRTPWWEFADLDTEGNKLLQYHLENAKPMPVPYPSSVQFNLMYTDGTMGKGVALTMHSQRDKKLWHLYLKTRGQYIKEAIKELRMADIKGDAYQKEINSAMSRASKEARRAVEENVLLNPYKK